MKSTKTSNGENQLEEAPADTEDGDKAPTQPETRQSLHMYTYIDESGVNPSAAAQPGYDNQYVNVQDETSGYDNQYVNVQDDTNKYENVSNNQQGIHAL